MDEPVEGMGQKIYTVSELTEEISGILEEEFPFVWVEGEISNFRIPASGHLYFLLKDDESQLRCVMFKHHAKYLSHTPDRAAVVDQKDGDENGQPSLFSPDTHRIEEAPTPTPFEPKDGMHVLVLGRIGVYAPRGEYQLIADSIRPVGMGAMMYALETLKETLREKGYFDPERKKPLPFLPQEIAIVTSATGAALFDMLRVIYQRFPPAHTLIVPVRVQGEGAAREIAAAIELINRERSADVIICGRGGGSLEDLWAFNTEIVADSIYASKIPVISAVGHEIDVTISDFVADVRAPTPTAAAQIVVPRLEDLLMTLDSAEDKLSTHMTAALHERRKLIEASITKLRIPAERLKVVKRELLLMQGEMTGAVRRTLMGYRGTIESRAAALHRLDPNGVLARGYSIAQRERDGKILTDSSDIAIGEVARVRLASGKLKTHVIEKEDGEKS
jgi:exodeoxyribonuclease VII large subunit